MALALDPRYVVVIRPTTDARTASHRRREAHEVYVRRRLVVAIVAFMIAAAACLGVRVVASRGDATASIPTVTPLSAGVSTASGIDPAVYGQGNGFYVVRPGDTLWSIASSLTDGSISSFVNELVELNGGSSIDVGQRLVVPAR